MHLMNIQSVFYGWIGSLCIIASITWLVGRASLRRTFEKAVRAIEIIKEQKSEISYLTKENEALEKRNSDMKRALNGIVSLASTSTTIGG